MSKVTQLKSGRELGSNPGSQAPQLTSLTSYSAVFHCLKAAYSCLPASPDPNFSALSHSLPLINISAMAIIFYCKLLTSDNSLFS